jgi:hypothetical protein
MLYCPYSGLGCLIYSLSSPILSNLVPSFGFCVYCSNCGFIGWPTELLLSLLWLLSRLGTLVPIGTSEARLGIIPCCLFTVLMVCWPLFLVADELRHIVFASTILGFCFLWSCGLFPCYLCGWVIPRLLAKLTCSFASCRCDVDHDLSLETLITLIDIEN